MAGARTRLPRKAKGFRLPRAAWSASERRAWKRPEPLTVAEWAEKNRRLSAKQSNFSGPFRTARAPYLIGLMNLALHPKVNEVWLQKAAQIGGSEAVRCVIGYLAERDPDPALFIMPDEANGRKIIGERLIPLFEETDCLRSLHTGIRRDVQLNSIALSNAFRMRLGYSGSPTSLKSDPIRYVFPDEVDDFVDFSGKNADPISMARKRMRTYGRLRLLYGLSTPTVDGQGIAQLVADSPIRLWYWIPCPECGKYQRLTFDRLRWDKPPKELSRKDQAAWIKMQARVWISCQSCDHQMVDSEKPVIVSRGLWAVEEVGPLLRWDAASVATPGGRHEQPGNYTDEGWPAGDRVGCQISSLYCLWVEWADIAAEFVAAQGDIAALIDFHNQTVGEPFKSQITRTPTGVFEAKSLAGIPPKVVPGWASVLIGTADVQDDRIYWVIRAWGYRYWSQRIDHGIARSLEELRAVMFDAHYPSVVEGQMPLRVTHLGIDTQGHRTQEVYRFVLSDNRVRGLRGEGKPMVTPVRVSRITYKDPRWKLQTAHVFLHRLDTDYYKNMLASLVMRKDEEVDYETGQVVAEDQDVWRLNSLNDPDYNAQMASEHRVLVRKGRARPVERWEPVTAGAANHYWDCEYYQIAMADIARVDLIGPPMPPRPTRKHDPDQRRDPWAPRPLGVRI